MRPINKGTWPTLKGGKKYVFNNWGNAKPHLIRRTGIYCHFCEMRINNCMAIEHIKAKIDYPTLSNNWTNFLLTCTSCNSNKLAKRLDTPYRMQYYWPHLNNTLLAFVSPISGPDALLVRPHFNLNTSQSKRAQATIDLYQLKKKVDSSGESDIRYLERQIAAKKAIDRYIEYMDGKATIPAIVDMATSTGFFSVWLDVFDAIPPVKEALLLAPEFKIDVKSWFDANFNPIPRNAAATDPI